MRSGRTLKSRRRLSNRNPDWSMLQGTHDASPRDPSSSHPHEDRVAGRPRQVQAVAFVAASHPAGAIGGGPGQHDPRRRAFRTAHRFCQLIPVNLHSLLSGPARCCLNPRDSGHFLTAQPRQSVPVVRFT